MSTRPAGSSWAAATTAFRWSSTGVSSASSRAWTSSRRSPARSDVPRERAVARVNLAAIERNVARLRRATGPGVALCAVVKADGYGHGAVPAARAALDGGATWLAVATAREAAELRAAGVEAPLLVLGALTADELAVALDARADVVAWREEFVAAIDRDARVHVKLDTGMGRLGTRDAAEATRVADAVAAAPGLELAGAMTHFATADEPGDDFMS